MALTSEKRDLRPSLNGLVCRDPAVGAPDVRKFNVGMQTCFGTIQTRKTEKGYIPFPLPIEYGLVYPLRPCEFTKVTGVDLKPGESDFYIVKNYDNVGTDVWVKLPHTWATVDSLQTIISEALPQFTSAQRNYAQTMALSRVSLAGWDGMVDFAEAAETAKFLRNPLDSMRTVMTGQLGKARVVYERNVRQSRRVWHTKKQKRSDYAEALAGLWLTGRYAVVPLVMSTGDIAETLAGKMKGLYKVFTARGAVKLIVPQTPYAQGGYIPSKPWNTVVTQDIRRYLEMKCSFCVRYYPTRFNKDLVELARWGLSPTMLPSALYEAFPFSFMLDWVSNLGSWIKAVTPKPELEILDVCRTETWKVTYTSIPRNFGYALKFNGKCEGGGGLITRNVMNRSIVTNSLDAPMIQFRSGGIKLLQAMDAASIAGLLLGQTIGRYAKLIGRLSNPVKEALTKRFLSPNILI